MVAVRQGTDEWREWRRNGVGSSDAGVIVGERDGYVELWAQKCGLIDEPVIDDGTRRLMDIGKFMEPTLLALYEHETGRKVRRAPTPKVHPDLPWMFASLDGTAGRRVVEAKWTNAGRWYDTGDDPVPGDVFAQVQHQLAVTGLPVADVAVLRGRDFHVIEVPRDDDYIGDLIAEEQRFWRYVETVTRPPLDGSEGTRRVLSAMHPQNDGSMLEATPEVEALVRKLAAAKATAKEIEAEADTMANALRALIGDADGFVGSWGKVTWKKSKDSERVNWPAVAAAYRLVIEELLATGQAPYATPEGLDALVSIHSETVVGPRVLRPDLKEQAA